jgi:hypothetical protein
LGIGKIIIGADTIGISMTLLIGQEFPDITGASTPLQKCYVELPQSVQR